MFTDYWGICSDDGAVEYFPPLSFITAAEGATTTTITITTADTATVTSTIIVSFGDGGSSLSVPMSTSTAIDTTTVIPEAVSTSTVIEITTVPAPTLVSGSETTTLITSTMTALRARDVVVG